MPTFWADFPPILLDSIQILWYNVSMSTRNAHKLAVSLLKKRTPTTNLRKLWGFITILGCLMVITWQCECEVVDPDLAGYELRAIALLRYPWRVTTFSDWTEEPFYMMDDAGLPPGVYAVSARSCDIVGNCSDYTPWYAWGRRQ